MPHDFRSSNYSHQDYQPRKRKANRRTNNREMVQSDELSSTSGARMISSDNPYDPRKNPHLSSTSLPVIEATGIPHPKSPAARAQQQSARSYQNSYQGAHQSSWQDAYPNAHQDASYQRGTSYQNLVRPADHAREGYEGHLTGSHPVVETAKVSQPDRMEPIVDPAQQSPDQQLPDQRSDRSVPAENVARTTPEAISPHMAYQDYTAASGRYKARPETNATSSFTPVRTSARPSRHRKRRWPRVVAAIVIVLAIGVGGYFAVDRIAYAGPVQATVNGETMTLEGNERSIEGLLDNNIVSVTPGNYIAVDDSVMREGEGTRCSALINEQQVTDLKTHINEGDQVVVSNGTDVMEAYTDSEPTVMPAGYSKVGQWGALHVFLPGQDGEKVTRTGSESGISVDQTTKEKIDDRLVYYNANSNGEKVVALTFDDGPWDTTTDQILDILKENDAKATFYTIGQQIPAHASQIERMAADGHEIATHTWDHAEGSGKGVSLDLMSTDERKQEVEKGLNVIKETSGKDASVYFRAPGGNFGEATANDLKDLISGEIGWNIDTEDWRRPGASVIAERIKSVKPGGIVLMHDGGGDRSQTVAGLREGVKYLKEQGYKFITISELIESYPYQEGQHS